MISEWLAENFVKFSIAAVWTIVFGYIIYVNKRFIWQYKKKKKDFIFFATLAIFIVLIVLVLNCTILAIQGKYL